MSVPLATVGATRTVPTMLAATSVHVEMDGCSIQTSTPAMVSLVNTTHPTFSNPALKATTPRE